MASSQRKQNPVLKEVPDRVIDSTKNKAYTKGKFLGKGGFARCYELIDNKTKRIYAGKVISKTMLIKKSQLEKMTQEIEIQQSIAHPNVVKMEGCFEDDDNFYILLELCTHRSLMELHKQRRAITGTEARYFTHQIVLACQYLHNKRIIHRDLKLGNLFLTKDMQVKVGDFGLATTLDYDGERKKTRGGTPNYIAPEMLDNRGHSYEVDIWAIGCILYTLLVGKPPFETETLKDTYNRIKNNQYVIPPRIGKDAGALIGRLLAADPGRRPKINDILNSPFFTDGFLPKMLPSSCLTMAPKSNMQAVSGGQTASVDTPNPRAPKKGKRERKKEKDAEHLKEQEEAKRKVKEEEERKRKEAEAEKEAKSKAEEEEGRKRQAEKELQRKAEEAEHKRKHKELERQRKESERKRKASEEKAERQRKIKETAEAELERLKQEKMATAAINKRERVPIYRKKETPPQNPSPLMDSSAKKKRNSVEDISKTPFKKSNIPKVNEDTGTSSSSKNVATPQVTTAKAQKPKVILNTPKSGSYQTRKKTVPQTPKLPNINKTMDTDYDAEDSFWNDD